MKTLTDLLRNRLAQYGAIEEEAWNAICDKVQPISEKKGNKLDLKPGGAYFLAKGLIKECVDWQGEGKFTILRILPEGGVLFTPAAMRGRYYKTLEDCELLGLDRRSLLKLTPWKRSLRPHFDELWCEWLQLLPDRVNLVRIPRKLRKQQFLLRNPKLGARIGSRDLANYLATSQNSESADSMRLSKTRKNERFPNGENGNLY